MGTDGSDPNAKGNEGEGKNINNNPDDGKNKNNGEGANKGDLSIPKSRFDEVSNELQTLKTEKEAREKKEREEADKKLLEEKKFEELSTKRQTELESANTTIRTLKVQAAVERVAAKAGAVDTEAVYKLLDQSLIKVDDKGQVSGVEEAVKALLEAKPFLKGSGGSPANIGGGSNPDQATGAKKPISWVKEKWSDPKWVREKHDDLDGKTGEQYLNELQAKGLIDFNS
jgi:hypothetical protein